MAEQQVENKSLDVAAYLGKKYLIPKDNKVISPKRKF